MTEPESLLLLPHIRIQNANAISSPLTWGFPSPTAFCGFAHALHRRLSTEYEIEVDGTLIVCHAAEPQVSTPSGKRTKSFALMRHPVNERGESAALVEEGRIHLDVSLVIGLAGSALHGAINPDAIAERAGELTTSMRIAGGSVLGLSSQPEIISAVPDERSPDLKRLLRKLLPGFALVSRERLLDAHWVTLRQGRSDATLLDALLDLTRLNFEPPDASADKEDKEGPSNSWHVRNRPGWLVPIPVGYAALSKLYGPGEVLNVRDRTVPFRFVEGLISAGQWLSPHRIADIRHAMWLQHFDSTKGIYRCTTPHYAGEV